MSSVFSKKAKEFRAASQADQAWQALNAAINGYFTRLSEDQRRNNSSKRGELVAEGHGVILGALKKGHPHAKLLAAHLIAINRWLPTPERCVEIERALKKVFGDDSEDTLGLIKVGKGERRRSLWDDYMGLATALDERVARKKQPQKYQKPKNSNNGKGGKARRAPGARAAFEARQQEAARGTVGDALVEAGVISVNPANDIGTTPTLADAFATG